MKKGFRRYTSVVVFLLVGILLFTPLFRFGVKADNTLQEGYLFLSRMKTNTATELTVMFTTTSAFSGEGITFRIFFPEAQGAWCTTGSFTEIEGVSTSPVELEDTAWDIDAALPGGVNLAAACVQGAAGANDYIEVTGIGNLTANTSYGFRIAEQAARFTNGPNAGSNLLSFQLQQGDDVENITFGINLIGDDQVTVTVTVEDAETITCSVGDDVPLGTLFLGGPYVIGDHTIGASSTSAFYFAVYGKGDDTEAGLLHTNTTDLLSSEPDTGDTLNLVTGEGFGLSVTSAGSATLPDKYNPSELGTGVFGAIYTDPSLLLTDADSDASYTITLAARASVDAEPGSYTETLTYISGV